METWNGKKWVNMDEKPSEEAVSSMAGLAGLGILVEAEHDGKNVCGYLTGNGSGKYTGIIVDGRTLAVPKITVKPNT